MITQLTSQLEKHFGSLSKTLFFEYQSIAALTGYFLDNYKASLIKLMGVSKAEPAKDKTDYATEAEHQVPVGHINLRRRSRDIPKKQPIPESESHTLDIAIIGISGRYPQARNLDEFWDNLRNGKDCITEIPIERWDHRQYFDEDKNKPGKTYSKWGGFLDGVDEFDPLFFNISPKEAELMDPQERLFLECVFEAMEDAGYTRDTFGLQQLANTKRDVGVYVGVMYNEYPLYGAQRTIQGNPLAISGSSSSIANRVSYYFDFHGPSMAIDTMCSSSLTAIHLACRSLQHGECGVAIAGGVNVSIHPNKYLLLAQTGFASSKGRCESFGEGGDGYVPGEGVGAVLLKPALQAVEDGDNIYGIIKATAINHGGKTNGYTVPNPNAQADVIGQVFKKSGIDPRRVSYIDAHGTGTSLGDPIEISGLKKAFETYTTDKQFCAIGSAKSNIGHCESAAGIAAISKILLQIKHKKLAPSLHSEELNSNIDFENSPFVVQQQLADWKRPVLGEQEYPRLAGVSSFGAGGANAHVLIEEYVPDDAAPLHEVTTFKLPAIIVLSAVNKDQLMAQVKRLSAYLAEKNISETDLHNIAFSLQVGREAMEERLAIIVHTLDELKEKLNAYAGGQENIDNLYCCQVKRNEDILAIFVADDDMEKAIDSWVSKRKFEKLLSLWVKGLVFDWNKLYGSIKPRRISLPTYPFARERYWIPEADDVLNVINQPATILHPLLHTNTSDLAGQ
ncbi:MAG TPA: hypothetical protein ENK04_14335, partial [Gammaproteobacteria bacterium]|nr:hypothetical protein [Gammaproteobacteria bacterium]